MSRQSFPTPRLRVVAGHSTGTAFEIPAGVSTIGREPRAELHLADHEVSRRHASLWRDGAQVTLTDLNSTNGTSINNRRLHGSQQLQSGDAIRIGVAELVYDGNRPRRGVRLGRIILVAAAVEVLGLLATSAFSLIAGRAVGVPTWLLTPTVAVATAIIQAIVQAATGSARIETLDARPRMARGRGTPAIVATAAVLLLLVGAGGFAAAVGIRYGVGWVTGNEDQVGRERLASTPAPTGRSGQVTVAVTSVVHTAHFTRVTLTVVNHERQPATLTLFHNCVLTAGGVTLQADPFKGSFGRFDVDDDSVVVSSIRLLEP
jgi:hypothetical protein